MVLTLNHIINQLKKEKKMKTNVTNIAIALFTLTTVFYGCKKEPLLPMQSKDETKSVQINQKLNLTYGQWKIISYEDGSQARPAPIDLLYGFLLKFNDGNVVIGTQKNISIYGKWSYFTEVESVGIISRLQWLILDFGDKPLTFLNNKWVVIKRSDTQIYLRGNKDDKPVYLTLQQTRVFDQVSYDRP
jgi:hypothetical protein